MKTLEEIRDFYEKELAADLQAMDIRRQQTVRKGLITAGVITLAGLILGGIIMASDGPPVFFIVCPAAGIIVGIIVFAAIGKGYVSDFKQRIIGKLIPFLEPGLQYFPQEYIQKEHFRQSDLFRQHIDRYRGEDLVHGRAGKTDLVFSEVHAEYKTQTRDHKGRTQTHWHTIFKGLFFIADFNKHFHGQTLVLPDTAEKMFGRFGQMLQSWNKMRGQLIKLEDPEFEKEFVVYGDDQIEARYILSTSLMQRIMDFKQRTKSQICISFTGSKVYVAVPMQKDLFEPKFFSSVADFAPIREYVEDLALAVDIVDDLNLNTRIWTKE